MAGRAEAVQTDIFGGAVPVSGGDATPSAAEALESVRAAGAARSHTWTETARVMLDARDAGSWRSGYGSWHEFVAAAAAARGVSASYVNRVVTAGEWYRGYVSRTRKRGGCAPSLAELDRASDATVARIAALWRRGGKREADAYMAGLIDGTISRREVIERCS